MLAAQVLEPVFEMRVSGSKLIDVLGDGQARRRSAVQSRAFAPHRRVLRASTRTSDECLQRRSAVRFVSMPSTRTRSRTSKTGALTNAGRCWPSCMKPKSSRWVTRFSRSKCCCVWRASTKRKWPPRRRRLRDLPSRARRRSGKSDRGACARPSVRAGSALGRAGDDSAHRDAACEQRRRDHRAAVPTRTAVRKNLRDVDNAIEVYREILTSDPNHGPTLQTLELLFAGNIRPIEIAGILEPLYRVAEQWEKLVRIHEVQLER